MTERYRRIDSMKNEHPMTALCDVFEVSRSGYYAWRERKPSSRHTANAVLVQEIRTLRQGQEVCYGSPRMTEELKSLGHPYAARTGSLD